MRFLCKSKIALSISQPTSTSTSHYFHPLDTMTNENAANVLARPSFTSLPENCISEILSFTSPKDACGACVISWGLKSAAESDIVWEKFLPHDYREVIVSKATSPLSYSTKKELYFSLCDSPTILDGGTMSVMINKESGKVRYMLGARTLTIAWADNPAHWRWTSSPKSRFPEVAELLGVCSLDIQGNIKTRLLSDRTRYAAYLVFRFSESVNGLDVQAKASLGYRGKSEEELERYQSSDALLRLPIARYERRVSSFLVRLVKQTYKLPASRHDGWMEIELGEFDNDRGVDGELEMQFSVVDHLNLKSGLIIEGVEVRPKSERVTNVRKIII